jgi:hypothetical protein
MQGILRKKRYEITFIPYITKMREIRFHMRVKLRGSNPWCIQDVVDIDFDRHSEWPYKFRRAKAENWHRYWHNDIELMQYTWLNDKNGKPIYEWDILKWNKRYYPITIDIFHWIRVHMGEWPITRADAENSEVTGNIYENPDLLSNL